MSLLDSIFERYLGGNAAPRQVADDFHQVTQNIPPDVLSKGLNAALDSDRTPAAGQMIAQMFEASTPEQRAAMLNRLVAALGPNAGAVLGGLLGSAAAGAGGPPTVTPGQAARVDPQQVQDAVAKAQRQSPDIVGTLSDFYAQHPTLVKTLGSAALAIALGKISQHMKGGA